MHRARLIGFILLVWLVLAVGESAFAGARMGSGRILPLSADGVPSIWPTRMR